MSTSPAQILDQSPLTADTWLDNLDQRETLFVLAYVECLNVKRAAIEAGYPQSIAVSVAYGWVSKIQCTKPHVLAAIDFEMKRRASEVIVTRDMILRRMRALAFADVRRIVKWRPRIIEDIDEDSEEVAGKIVIRNTVTNQVEVYASDELDEETAAAIKSIKQDKDGNVTIELHDPKPALRDLGKYMGLLEDKRTIRFERAEERQPIDQAETAKQAAEAWQGLLGDDD